MTTIPILVGSIRTDGNSQGIASWVSWRWNQFVQTKASESTKQAKVTLATQLLPDLPLGGVTDPVMGSLVTDPAKYADPAVTKWSKLVSSSPALIIVTPQYNWGYPGILKNALDHLYWEWKGKPILLLTYGGHGGIKCANQLREVMEGGLKTVFVSEPVMITLPKSYIRENDRVKVFDELEAEKQYSGSTFLSDYHEPLDEAFTKLWNIINTISTE